MCSLFLFICYHVVISGSLCLIKICLYSHFCFVVLFLYFYCCFVVVFDVFFFFKQKTAYEMRISDWSSDVCSSDLFLRLFAAHQDERGAAIVEAGRVSGGDRALLLERETQPGKGSHLDALADELVLLDEGVALAALDRHRCDLVPEAAFAPRLLGLVLRGGRERVLVLAGDLIFLGEVLGRSEEHTSELQSLMRISYAVFCLKKKTHHK